MTPHVRPFSRENAVHHHIAHAAVATDAVMANHPVLLGAERFDGALRPKIEIVGPQADHFAGERVERMAQQQQLAGGVDVRALAAAAVPGMADFQAVDRRCDIVIPGRTNDDTARQVAYDPGQHVPSRWPWSASAT